MDILKDFGVQPVLLVAQIINFCILLIILRKLLYKPMLAMLEDRKKRIAESMEQAKTIEERLAKLDEEQEKVLAKARKEADTLIAEAKESAKTLSDDAFAKAREQAESLLLKAREASKAEYARMRTELRADMVRVAVVAAQKATEGILTPEQKERIAEKATKEIVS